MRGSLEREGCDSGLGPKIGQKFIFVDSLWYTSIIYMWSMTRVSLRAFDCALGTQKRSTTAGGTHVSETPA